MNAHPRFVLLLAAMIPCAGPMAQGQDAARWQVPPAVIPIDFTLQDPAPRKALAKTGLAWEIPVTFAMLRENVTLAATLPEAGEVSFVLGTKESLVDIATNRVDAGKVNIAIQSRLGRMDVDALQKSVHERINTVLAEPRRQASAEVQKMKPPALRNYLGNRAADLDDNGLAKAYVDRRGIELGKSQLQAALEELVTQRPKWVTKTEQAIWVKADARKLHGEYQRLSTLFLADEHLRKCGIQLDTSTRNYAALIESKFKALQTFVSGGSNAGDVEAASVRTLSREEMAGLREALVVEGVCRFVPAVDAGDANAQWFNAQRVGTSVAGVQDIRVVGALNPEQGDRSDWWILVGFQEDKVQLSFPEKSGFRHELYRDPLQRTCLRIVATDRRGAVYEFGLRRLASGTAGEAVVVHESPDEGHAKFPY